jgi:hypothetical protein
VNWIGRLRVPIVPGGAGQVGRPASYAGRDPGLFGGGGADHAGVDHEGELGIPWLHLFYYLKHASEV